MAGGLSCDPQKGSLLGVNRVKCVAFFSSQHCGDNSGNCRVRATLEFLAGRKEFAYFTECPLIRGRNEFSGPWGARSGGAWCAIPGLQRANTNPGEMYPIDSAGERCRRISADRDGEDSSVCASGTHSASETRCPEMSGFGADTGTGDPGRDSVSVLRAFYGDRDWCVLRRGRV